MTEHQLNHLSHGGTCIDDSVNELSHLECAAEKFKSSGFTHAMSEKTLHQEASSMSSKAEQTVRSPMPQQDDRGIMQQILLDFRLIRNEGA